MKDPEYRADEGHDRLFHIVLRILQLTDKKFDLWCQESLSIGL